MLVIASLALAACGSSSSDSSTSASASTSAAKASTTGAPGARGTRFAAIRECLQKNGVTLQRRTPGQQRPSGGGFLPGGGQQLPKGVTRAQFQAAIKKCGGFPGGARLGAGGTARVGTPAFKQALAKFATCLRQNGVNIPAPNTTGKGPIFNTKRVNTASGQFKAADLKCSGLLRSTLRATPGAGGAPGGSGAPPAH